YLKTGRRADMTQTLDRLKRQAAGHPAAYELSGKLYLKANDPRQAIKEFEEGIRNFPKGKSVFQKLIVEALMAENHRVDAVKLNDQILRDRPDDPDALAKRANYALEDGEVEKAIGILEGLLRRAPNHPVGHYNLGRALLVAGREENARVQFS